MPVRTAQFPKVSELGEVLREQISQAGLNIELRMVDTTQHLQYETKPFVTDEGPIAMQSSSTATRRATRSSRSSSTCSRGAAQAEFGATSSSKS